ncbi:GGDEF domain-containing protein [Sphingomonas suaedae]|uniref:GGDEF domain-containing protein n=1 Tax=Sphingomonas suaedae TaxID=2599297 RepID=A0A518RC97_9SPHN|nr:GGDEF domain-containing protein [Sphingomonas suaedae]QDX25077.1 GGDEF domain-containing protein [Sphingomonas suaedae]
MFASSKRLSEATYIAIVRSLFATLTPTVIMAMAFLGVGTLVALETRDPLLTLLIAGGAVAVVARLYVLLRYRLIALGNAFDLSAARHVEQLFAIPYLAFAAIFGAFSTRAFHVAGAESHMLVIGLVFGYAAGVAAGIFLRPWIALPSIAMAVIPTGAAALITLKPTYVAVGALLLLFLMGGIHSMLRNYRVATAEITARAAFATLARVDALTGLENRLSLREAYDRVMDRAGQDGFLVVHCLDLDRFKAVNDTHGHPVGDALLKAVSDRLRRVLREGDVAARIGGDEFVLLQAGAHPGEADLLARRVARTVAESYSILGHQISIGTSVGYAIHPQHGRDLDELIARADEALLRAKRTGGGIAAYKSDAPRDAQRLSA